MKMSLAPTFALFLLAAALSGCGKSAQPGSPSNLDNTSGATATDVAQVNAAVAANPTLVDEELSGDPTPMAMDPSIVGDHHRRPLRWWRTIDSTTRTVSFAYGDPDSLGRPTTAVATVNRHLMGTFHVVMRDSLAPDSARRVNKPLDDQWVRRLALRRFRIDSTGTVSVWRVVGTSGVEVTSAGATTNIQSIRIQGGGRDTTITDPLQLHRLRHLICVRGFAPVHVTVTTDRSDDLVYLYRWGNRRPFVNNGDGTYSLEFVAFDFGGLQHLGVNAFSRGTILSDTDPYDSNAWILPHAARPWDAVAVIDRH